jgi:hypothetical protein
MYIRGDTIMHFWDIDSLAEKLRNNTLTERQSFYYLLLTLLLGLLSLSPHDSNFSSWSNNKNYLMVFQIVWLVTETVGVNMCFSAHQRSGGKDFIRQFICLSLPAGVRSAVYTVLLTIVMAIPMIIFVPKDSMDISTMLTKGISMELVIIFQVYLIYKRMRGVADTPST